MRDDIKKTLILVARHGPDHRDNKKADYACWFCDMGGAGYSTKGDGYHDDKPNDYCAALSAQNILIKEGIEWL